MGSRWSCNAGTMQRAVIMSVNEYDSYDQLCNSPEQQFLFRINCSGHYCDTQVRMSDQSVACLKTLSNKNNCHATRSTRAVNFGTSSSSLSATFLTHFAA